MNILIAIKEKKVKVSLFDGTIEKDSLEIIEEHSLSKKLLPSIEELLARNNFDRQNVKEMRVESDQNETFTTTRIAKAVEEVWIFSKNVV